MGTGSTTVFSSVDLRYCVPYGYAHLKDLPDTRTLNRFYGSRFWTAEADYLKLEARTQWYWQKIYADWVDLVQRYGSPTFWVDVGCGAGHLLHFVSRRGFNTIGVDPAEQSTATYKRDFLDPELSFYFGERGILSAINVLEHVADPIAFLAKVNGVLRPGGLFLVQVPNEFNRLQQRLTIRHGVWWLSPVHLNYFSDDRFRELLEAQGFEVLTWGYTFPMELFAVLGFDYINHPRLGTLCHFVRMVLEYPNFLRRAIRRLCHHYSVGREVWVLARSVNPPEHSHHERCL